MNRAFVYPLDQSFIRTRMQKIKRTNSKTSRFRTGSLYLKQIGNYFTIIFCVLSPKRTRYNPAHGTAIMRFVVFAMRFPLML